MKLKSAELVHFSLGAENEFHFGRYAEFTLRIKAEQKGGYVVQETFDLSAYLCGYIEADWSFQRYYGSVNEMSEWLPMIKKVISRLEARKEDTTIARLRQIAPIIDDKERDARKQMIDSLREAENYEIKRRAERMADFVGYKLVKEEPKEETTVA